MKKLVFIFIILIGICIPAQQTDNRFEQAEYDAAASAQSAQYTDPSNSEVAKDTGPNPADPAPIDDYLPLLFIAAVGIIAYRSYRKTRAA